MNEEDYWIKQEISEKISEKISEETPQEYLTRICYIRNFDPPNLKKDTNETNILRGTMENSLERTKDSRVGSTRASSEEKQ